MRPGYWTDAIVTTDNANASLAFECSPAEACEGGFESRCRFGHGHVICSRCIDSFYQDPDSRLCQLSPSGRLPAASAIPIGAISTLLLSFVLGLLLMACNRRAVMRNKLLAKLAESPVPPWLQQQPEGHDEYLQKLRELGRGGASSGDLPHDAERLESTWEESTWVDGSKARQDVGSKARQSAAAAGVGTSRRRSIVAAGWNAITDRVAQATQYVDQTTIQVAEKVKGRRQSLPAPPPGARIADVWVQKEVDLPGNFGAGLVAKLSAHGVDASLEADDEPADLSQLQGEQRADSGATRPMRLAGLTPSALWACMIPSTWNS